MKHIWDEEYPAVYAEGVAAGLKAAFGTPVTNQLRHQRGRLCPCGCPFDGDTAIHRGFKAGWTAVRKVRARRGRD